MRQVVLAFMALMFSSAAFARSHPVKTVADCGMDLQLKKQGVRFYAFSSVQEEPVRVFVVDSDSADGVKLMSMNENVTIYIQRQERPGLGFPGQLYVGRRNYGFFCERVNFSSLK